MEKEIKINLTPQNIDAHNWFYDGKKYFTFVHEVYNKGGEYVKTDTFDIDIKKLTDMISNLQYGKRTIKRIS